MKNSSTWTFRAWTGQAGHPCQTREGAVWVGDWLPIFVITITGTAGPCKYDKNDDTWEEVSKPNDDDDDFATTTTAAARAARMTCQTELEELEKSLEAWLDKVKASRQ